MLKPYRNNIVPATACEGNQGEPLLQEATPKPILRTCQKLRYDSDQMEMIKRTCTIASPELPALVVLDSVPAA